MARYRFLSVDLVTGTVRDEVDLATVSFGDTLNRASGFSATIPNGHPSATPSNLGAADTLIAVERNGAIVGGGIVWDPRSTRRGDARMIEVAGGSVWTYFAHRVLDESRSYVDVDDATIIADLVDWTQGNADPSYGVGAGDPTGRILGGIDTSGVSPVGVTSEANYAGDERMEISTLLENLAGTVDGPDVWLRLGWSGETIGAFLEVDGDRGVRQADPWSLGRQVRDYDSATLGSRTENRVAAIGQGEGSSMLVAVAADPSTSPSYPRLDGVVSHKSVKRVETLTGHAAARLVSRARPPRVTKVYVDPDATPRFGGWQTGDEVRLVIEDGYTQVDDLVRIVAWTFDVDTNTGEETLAVDTAPI